MNGDLLRTARRLLDARRPYALATVVRRERPSSAAPGNTAIITVDGRVHGWIGGSCTQPEVVRHALAALADGQSRLLGFGARPNEGRDIVPVPMSCGSEGRVEVHINPVFPAPRLVVAGSSPIADAVARLGEAMGHEVVRAHADDATDQHGAAPPPGADDPDGAPSAAEASDLATRAQQWADRSPGAKLFAVVATMGRGDEEAVRRIMVARPDYVGVVVSPKRMRQVRAVLEDLGLGAEEVARVRGPAGLDIGAESPEEVAVSILAEIVAVGAGKGAATATKREPGAKCCAEPRAAPAAPSPSPAPAAPSPAPAQATDPVCGMTVPTDGSRPSTTHEGNTVYFCCPGCRARFEADPGAYA